MAPLSVDGVAVDPGIVNDALQLQIDNLAAPIAPTPKPPDSGFPFNQIAVRVLRKRCADARDAGSKNIAVDVDLLLELFNGTDHGMQNGFTSDFQV